MTTFEIIAITLSLILGLSISNLLWSGFSLIRDSDETEIHWIPLSWSGLIVLAQLQYWFAVLSIDMLIDLWTWSWYLNLLFLGLLLFAASALVLPSESQRKGHSLKTDFDLKGRYALIPFALYYLGWFFTNYRVDEVWFHEANVANLVITALIFVASTVRRSLVQTVATLTVLVITLWATFFIWAQLAITA